MKYHLTRATCALSAAVVCLTIAAPAEARRIPFQTPGQLKNTCDAAGGRFIPPGENKVYGCEFSTGTVSCGGAGEHQNTCSNDAPGRKFSDMIKIPKANGGLAGNLEPGGGLAPSAP
jgi:hypothetical protein